jgi:hypothetical protein
VEAAGQRGGGLPAVANQVLKWVAVIVDAIAMPIAPPSCWDVLSSPDASPPSCLATPARPAIEMGTKAND